MHASKRTVSKCKIAVVGCGALGLNYGTRLLEAQLCSEEHIDISLVLRRDYELVKEGGILVEYGPTSTNSATKEANSTLYFSAVDLQNSIFNSTQAVAVRKGTMDWVLVCCKSYSIDNSLYESLAVLDGPGTKYLIIMNGLGIEDAFVEWFGEERVLGGLSHIAANRGPNPPIQDKDGNYVSATMNIGSSLKLPLKLNVYLDLVLEIGHVQDKMVPVHEALSLFANTAIRDNVHGVSNLLQARWKKLCWNLTYAGMSVAMGGLTCDVIMETPSLRLLSENVMRDVISVANADIQRQFMQRRQLLVPLPVPVDKVDSPSSHPPTTIHNARTPTTTSDGSIMNSVTPDICGDLLDADLIVETLSQRTVNAGPYKTSTVLDLVEGRPMEMKHLFRVPLDRARELQKLQQQHMEDSVLRLDTGGDGSNKHTAMYTQLIHFAYLETILLMIDGIDRLSEKKKEKNIRWEPTYFTD
mmetsp:Transcript_4252/g.6833  ORF Transcript_4252/g.6833 Transcript_4252/m.6833 type:complete len:470 (-) Transcript_4252:508-1917(-)